MSDWPFLEQHRCTAATGVVPADYVSDSSFGFNGMFRFVLDTKSVVIIASDGGGWQHVSVSILGESKPPSWSIMCKVKDLFWDEEEQVMQLHPRKSQYVNNHRFCLHLWRPIPPTPPIPEPPYIFVGPKKGQAPT